LEYEVKYTWTVDPDGLYDLQIKYTIQSTYFWHDKFGWHTWEEYKASGNADTSFGAAVGRVERVFDGGLDCSYFFTIEYHPTKKGTVVPC